MSKNKGPLSKAEKFYVEQHIETDTKELAKDLNRTVAVVKKYKEALPPLDESIKTGDLMARNDRGATTMTEAASALADETKKAHHNEKKPRSGNIHFIRGK